MILRGRKARASLITSVLATALLITGCGTSAEAIRRASFTVPETSEPLALFSQARLDTLPSFDRFEQTMTKQGLKLTTKENDPKLYLKEGPKSILAVHGTEGKDVARGVAFLGSDNTADVGNQFLVEAERRTGGKAKERLPSSYFEFAVQLRNGSVLTHEVKRTRGQIRHFFLISPPVPRSEVDFYIYI